QRLKELDNQNKASMDQLAQQVVANTHGMYMGAIDSAMASFNERVAAVQADTNTATDKKPAIIDSIRKELDATLGMYQQMYSNINTINPDWTKFPTTSLPGASVDFTQA
ncbi:TPA: hypothetical protein ACQJJO_003501, partial [Aeromonas veronii]